MFLKRANLIVGLNVYRDKFLSLSVSALSRLPKSFVLVVHNNTNKKLTRRDIKDLGFGGKFYIINDGDNKPFFKSCMSIVNWTAKKKIRTNWFLFLRDNDLLLDTTIPNVKKDVLAITQNAVTMRPDVDSVLRILQNPNDYDIDGNATVLSRPNLAMNGALIRARVFDALSQITDDDISGAQMLKFVTSAYGDASAIYMDCVNLLAVAAAPLGCE